MSRTTILVAVSLLAGFLGALLGGLAWRAAVGMRSEVERLASQVAVLENRLAASEAREPDPSPPAPRPPPPKLAPGELSEPDRLLARGKEKAEAVQRGLRLPVESIQPLNALLTTWYGIEMRLERARSKGRPAPGLEAMDRYRRLLRESLAAVPITDEQRQLVLQEEPALAEFLR